MNKLICIAMLLLLASQLIAAEKSPDRRARDAGIAGAHWLVRHQHADGRWSSNNYTSQCKKPKGSCKLHGSQSEVVGVAGNDVAVTSLALLAFSCFGVTHKDGWPVEFAQSVKKAVEWLVKQQNLDSTSEDYGSFGSKGAGAKPRPDAFVYNQALATMAISEMLHLSGDRALLGERVRLATQWCLKNQSSTDGGWGYSRRGESNSSISAWMVLALKASKFYSTKKLSPVERKSILSKLKHAAKFFRDRTHKKTHVVKYSASKTKSDSKGVAAAHSYVYSNKLPTMTASSLLVRLLCGEKRRTEALIKACEMIAKFPPKWQKRSTLSASPVDLCYWYFASYGFFQLGGEKWDVWRDQLYSALLPAKTAGLGQRQIEGSCEHGSWDPIGRWGAAGGRIYSTALAIMTLDICFRYPRKRK